MDDSRDVKASRVTGTRERMQQTINIRKEKRLANWRKRHARQGSPEAKQGQAGYQQQQQHGIPSINGAPGTPPPLPYAGAGAAADIDIAYLDHYAYGVRHGNEEEQLKCTRKIRKLLSKEDNPPAMEIIQKGLVPNLVHFLTFVNNTKLQFEAAWALTNIASTEHTKYVTVDRPPLMRNAVPLLARLMKSPNPDVREQSCWCLGNVAGDGHVLRNIVLSTPFCLKNLILNIVHAHNASMLKNATWALSNFCRGKPQPAIHVIQPALIILSRLLHCINDEVLRDACWAFSYVSDGDDSRIEAVLKVEPLQRLVALLAHEKSSVVTPALRSLGNIISGNDAQTQRALNAGAMQALIPLLGHERANIQKEACWTLSNIAAGTPQQARSLVHAVDNVGHSVMSRVITLANGGNYDVRKEAAWVLANICTGSDPNNIRVLVDATPTSAITALCNLLTMEDLRMLHVGLEALEAILSKGHPQPGQSFEAMIDMAGGVDHIERLCDHRDEDLYLKATGIYDRWFTTNGGDDEESDDDIRADAFGPHPN